MAAAAAATITTIIIITITSFSSCLIHLVFKSYWRFSRNP